jgi:hypothetical protein
MHTAAHSQCDRYIVINPAYLGRLIRSQLLKTARLEPVFAWLNSS